MLELKIVDKQQTTPIILALYTFSLFSYGLPHTGMLTNLKCNLRWEINHLNSIILSPYLLNDSDWAQSLNPSDLSWRSFTRCLLLVVAPLRKIFFKIFVRSVPSIYRSIAWELLLKLLINLIRCFTLDSTTEPPKSSHYTPLTIFVAIEKA